MPTIHVPALRIKAPAWNKGWIIGQKRSLQPKHVWAIRVRLDIPENIREIDLLGSDPQTLSNFAHRVTLINNFGDGVALELVLKPILLTHLGCLIASKNYQARRLKI